MLLEKHKVEIFTVFTFTNRITAALLIKFLQHPII